MDRRARTALLAGRRLYLLLTRSLCAGKPLDVLGAAIGAGVDLVQVREKPFGDDDARWIDEVSAVCADHAVPVLVNDRIDLARATGAAGVHLGQHDLAGRPERSLRRRSFLLGISTHDPAELERAVAEDPDYIGIGPCHATPTKGYAHGLPDRALEALVGLAPVPAFAIGGITAANAGRLAALGVTRAAVCRAILAAPDPGRAAAAIRRALAG